MNATQDLGTLPVRKLLAKLSLPAIVAQVINMLYNMVDRIYIGHIPVVGKLALTGVGVCLPLIMLISAFAVLASMGGAPYASMALGRGEKDKAEEILGECTALLLCIAVILTLFFVAFSDKLLLAFGASENTITYASSYMRIYALGTIFVQLTLGLNMFISSQGDAKTSMFTVMIGAICNSILDPIFIFALNMGVQGAALATVISQAISSLWIIHYLTGKKSALKLRRKQLKLKKSVIGPCLALGVSPFIMQSTESLLSICFNASLLKYGGDLAVGAMTIFNSVNQCLYLPLHGLTQGSQPIISYNYGAGNEKRVRDGFNALLTTSVAYSVLFWACIMLFPSVFIKIFTSDPELVAYASRMLRVFMAMGWIMGIQLSCQQTFLAIGNAKSSLFLALLRKIILLIPMIYLLPHLFSDKTFAVFLAEPVSDTLAATTTALLFVFQFRKALDKLIKRKTDN